MFETLCGWLLRLYPADFRERYGDEALQLVRDRMRDERGLAGRARLVTDLAHDVVVSLPRTHREARLASGWSASGGVRDGVPCFAVLHDEALSGRTIVSAGLLSTGGLVLFAVMLGQAGRHGFGAAPTGDGGSLSFASDVAVRSRRGGAADGTRGTGASGRGGRGVSGDGGGAGQHAGAAMSAGASGQADAVDAVDAAERRRVVEAIAADIEQHYFDREAAGQIAQALQAHERNGDDDAAVDGGSFAALVTGQMRDAGHDMHLNVEYSREVMPSPREPSAAELASYKGEIERSHCQIERAEVLPDNIGYLKLNGFAELGLCRASMVEAIKAVHQPDAMILDLRDNAGGAPEMVTFVAGYFFDHPVLIYNPREAETRSSWTQSPVQGSALTHTRLFVLTSGRTWSAAEQFCYSMKGLKRATLVGETTRGGAHAGRFFRIDDHFGVGIPEVKVRNPYGSADWEGVGVQPDLRVASGDALDAAKAMAQRSRTGRWRLTKSRCEARPGSVPRTGIYGCRSCEPVFSFFTV